MKQKMAHFLGAYVVAGAAEGSASSVDCEWSVWFSIQYYFLVGMLGIKKCEMGLEEKTSNCVLVAVNIMCVD